MIVAPAPVVARILRNDSAEAGRMIGFYPRLQGGHHFAVILDVPDDLPSYDVCAVQVWIGPNDFNVFTVDIWEVDADGLIVSDIYRSDLDAFQVFGSQQALNEIDLRNLRISSQARRIRLQMTHAEGFDAPPTIAFDDDGITPAHNYISGLLRSGDYLHAATEDLPEEGEFPRPPGDWVLRLLVVGEDEVCPQTGAVEVDGGVIVTPPDARIEPPPPPPEDAAPKPDREFPDARVPPDAQEEDARPGRSDAGRPDEEAGLPGDVRVIRVTPAEGPFGENTTVLIEGRGFPVDGDVEVLVGPERALEVEVADERSMSAIFPSTLPLGVHDVEVVRGDGDRDVLVEAFTVTGDAPAGLELTGVLPTSIVEDTLPTLTLLGRGFTDDIEFMVGPVLLQGVALTSPQRATAVLSTPLPPGIYTVAARLGDARAELAGGLTVLEASGSPSSDGCGCRTSATSSAWGPGALLLAGLLRRRRRR